MIMQNQPIFTKFGRKVVDMGHEQNYWILVVIRNTLHFRVLVMVRCGRAIPRDTGYV